MSYFVEDVMIPLLITLTIAAFGFAGLYFVVAAIGKLGCDDLAEVTGRATAFRWVGGCYVDNHGEMLPYEKWKLLELRTMEVQ